MKWGQTGYRRFDEFLFGATHVKNLGTIVLQAGLLQEALATAVPKARKNSRPKKPWPLTLVLDKKAGRLELFEAKHGLKGYWIPARGRWPNKVQVDGHLLRKLAEKYEIEEQITLTANEIEFAIEKDGSRISLRRLDAVGKKGFEHQPIPPDPRHTGPVEIPPDPVQKKYEWGDTWDLSARVPIPQHRDPKKSN